MSFFKKILSDTVGDIIPDNLLGDTAKKLAKGASKVAARTALNTAAEKATERAVEYAVDSAADSLMKRSNPLDTPPAPPIPQMEKPLSVMVAVNGESYGPYERAGLLKMIADGSLTRETYVFISGMSNWTPAGQVPEVAALFSMNAPAPAVPPVPWAESAPKAPAPAPADNNFSQKLNNLITAAVADGEISDLERQVLIRNAQEEGVAMDEFVMVLEARLYEQRRVLQSQEEARRNAATMAQAAQRAAEAPKVAPVAPKTDKPKKCPHCGAPIKLLASKCPECGYDYPSETEERVSAWEKLSRALEAVDNEKASGLMGGLMNMVGQDTQSPDKIAKKKRVIENFPIPSDKQGIFDFFVSCAPLTKADSFFSRNQLEGSYKKKAQQVLLKARIILKDDPKLLAEINELAKQYKIKA